MNKLPPIEKIYEAWSAIEDGRITLLDDGTQAVVASSDGAKTYRVVRQIEDGKIIYRSNDKATYWQGYPGYPVIAMLMMEKQLPLDLTVAGWFAGVNWHEVNMAHKSDYAAALQEVIESKGLKKERVTHARQDAEKVMDALKTLDVEVGRLSTRAKKSD